MQYSKLLCKTQTIAATYNLARQKNAGETCQPSSVDWQEVARSMRNQADELFGELADELAELESSEAKS